MLKAVANRAYKAFVACALGAAVVFAPAGAYARQVPDTPVSSPIALAELPPQGRATYALIREGGPFPHDKDGSVFGNRERLLPTHKRGYCFEKAAAQIQFRFRRGGSIGAQCADNFRLVGIFNAHRHAYECQPRHFFLTAAKKAVLKVGPPLHA